VKHAKGDIQGAGNLRRKKSVEGHGGETRKKGENLKDGAKKNTRI